MTRPCTFTDGRQLKKQTNSTASAIYTFTFIYLELKNHSFEIEPLKQLELPLP